MKTRIIVIYAIVFSLVSAAVCLFVLKGSDGELPQYTTEINRLIVRLGDDWEKVSAKSGELFTSDEDFDYAVVDSDGDVLCFTKEDMSQNISAATKNYDIIRDITANGKVVGKLIVHNTYANKQAQARTIVAVMIGIMAFAMLAVSVGYFIYLRKRVVAPFGRLESFAVRVASGDLDTPLEMDRQNIFGAFTESFDIMREELKASRLREEAAVKSRKEMIAELSHDIKTPVASIKAMTEFLDLVTDDAEQKQTIAAIGGKADQIDKLISNLFHATLEELEQLEVKPEELSSEVLAEMITQSDHLKKVKSAKVEQCVILADRLRLEQVVGNILSNSYKYADTDIEVASFFEGGCLVVEFSDKGGGVAESELEVITEKFRRGSNAQGKDGSGIGLYISKYLMERMSGELACRNNGEGFTVTLRLKLA